MVATDLSKQQALDADAKATKQINFTGNPENNSSIFFITEEAKETTCQIFTGNCKSHVILFCVNIK